MGESGQFASGSKVICSAASDTAYAKIFRNSHQLLVAGLAPLQNMRSVEVAKRSVISMGTIPTIAIPRADDCSSLHLKSDFWVKEE